MGTTTATATTTTTATTATTTAATQATTAATTAGTTVEATSGAESFEGGETLTTTSAATTQATATDATTLDTTAADTTLVQTTATDSTQQDLETSGDTTVSDSVASSTGAGTTLPTTSSTTAGAGTTTAARTTATVEAVAVVSARIELTGITASQFDTSLQAAFISSVSTLWNVSPSVVAIVGFTDVVATRRRLLQTALQIDMRVTSTTAVGSSLASTIVATTRNGTLTAALELQGFPPTNATATVEVDVQTSMGATTGAASTNATLPFLVAASPSNDASRHTWHVGCWMSIALGLIALARAPAWLNIII